MVIIYTWEYKQLYKVTILIGQVKSSSIKQPVFGIQINV